MNIPNRVLNAALAIGKAVPPSAGSRACPAIDAFRRYGACPIDGEAPVRRLVVAADGRNSPARCGGDPAA